MTYAFFLSAKYQGMDDELLVLRLTELRAQLAELTKRLSYWTTTETLEEGATPSQALSFGVTGLYFNFSKITRLNVRPFTAF